MVCCRYENELVLADSTVGYHLTRHSSDQGGKPFCGFVSKFSKSDIELIQCDKSRLTSYLCEFDISVNDSSKTDKPMTIVNLLTHTQWHWNSSSRSQPETITCPRGHATHTFLACDMVSECWLEERKSVSFSSRSSAVCLAPLNPLLPSFACRDKGQFVPYTLVCDHRSDCFDGSDEDFCVFPGDSPFGFICSGHNTVQCGHRHEVVIVVIVSYIINLHSKN